MREDAQKPVKQQREGEFMRRGEVVLNHARQISAKSKAALRAVTKDDASIVGPPLRGKRRPIRSH